MENYFAEKIAVGMFRSARLLSHEQNILGALCIFNDSPFDSQSVDRVLRFQTTIDRQLAKDIEQLERLQDMRKARAEQDHSPDAGSDDLPNEQNESEERPSDDTEAQ